jgi:hypothetical protein
VRSAVGRSSDYVHVCSWFHGLLQLIADTYDSLRFHSMYRECESVRTLETFSSDSFCRAVADQIQGILTFGSSVGELMWENPRTNNCLCIMVMAYLISKIAILYSGRYCIWFQKMKTITWPCIMIKFSAFSSQKCTPCLQVSISHHAFFFKSEAKPAGTLAYIEICLHSKTGLYLENLRNLFVDGRNN